MAKRKVPYVRPTRKKRLRRMIQPCSLWGNLRGMLRHAWVNSRKAGRWSDSDLTPVAVIGVTQYTWLERRCAE